MVPTQKQNQVSSFTIAVKDLSTWTTVRLIDELELCTTSLEAMAALRNSGQTHQRAHSAPYFAFRRQEIIQELERRSQP